MSRMNCQKWLKSIGFEIMKNRVTTSIVLFFSRKNKDLEVVVARCNESVLPQNLSDAEYFVNVDHFSNDSDDDDYNFYEEKNRIMFADFIELVKGTRYETFAKNTTSLWALEKLFSDSSAGKTRIIAKYVVQSEQYQSGFDEEGEDKLETIEDHRRFEIDAYHINSSDLDVLKRVLDKSKEEANDDPDRFQFTQYEIKVFQNVNDLAFDECYHPHYSSYNKVVGNMYDDNIDTYGSALGIKAVRCHLFYNTDTSEFVLADGRYWCI